jgi:hypothetical protein
LNSPKEEYFFLQEKMTTLLIVSLIVGVISKKFLTLTPIEPFLTLALDKPYITPRSMN